MLCFLIVNQQQVPQQTVVPGNSGGQVQVSSQQSTPLLDEGATIQVALPANSGKSVQIGHKNQQQMMQQQVLQ